MKAIHWFESLTTSMFFELFDLVRCVHKYMKVTASFGSMFLGAALRVTWMVEKSKTVSLETYLWKNDSKFNVKMIQNITLKWRTWTERFCEVWDFIITHKINVTQFPLVLYLYFVIFLLQKAKEALKAKQSVVVDNTNPGKADRKTYIDLAKKCGELFDVVWSWKRKVTPSIILNWNISTVLDRENVWLVRKIKTICSL